jgi:hypothetical protein
VNGVSCGGSQCEITSCSADYFDADGAYANGCECAADTVSNVCASAQVVAPAPIPLGGTGVEGPHTIVPAADQDYFVVDFDGATDCAFHPKVILQDASGVLRMDVTTDCNAPSGISCGEGGDSMGVTIWEFNYSDVCGVDMVIDPGQLPSSPSSIRVRVYAPFTPNQCLSYTLIATN